MPSLSKNEKEILKKFHEHCGIVDKNMHQIRKVEIKEHKGIQHISVYVYYKRIDFTDEYAFFPYSPFYDFLLEYFHLDVDM